jgi:hypothetical protein
LRFPRKRCFLGEAGLAAYPLILICVEENIWLRHKFADLTFVKVLLLLFFQEKKRSLRRSLKVLILVFNKSETPPNVWRELV